LPFFHLFLPPHLKDVSLTSGVHTSSPSPHLVQMVLSLPTSLEALTFYCGCNKVEVLQDAMSSFVSRCGQSLRKLDTSVPISETAIHHLVQLPNISAWTISQGLPRVIPTSIPPSLEELWFYDREALPWFDLIVSREKGALRNGSVLTTSQASVKGTLKGLVRSVGFKTRRDGFPSGKVRNPSAGFRKVPSRLSHPRHSPPCM